jgi:site-specific DNA-cytosine methylase
MKILELFSGYGTATFALKRLNIPHEVVGYSDIDKYANQCFQQNHGGKPRNLPI